MIIDASVVLRGFFPDEEGQAAAQAILYAYVQPKIDLQAPILLSYELINAILQAVRRQRMDAAKGKKILTDYFDLDIRTVEMDRGETGSLLQKDWFSFIAEITEELLRDHLRTSMQPTFSSPSP